MVGNKISSKYTDDHCRVNYSAHKVCDVCATINQKKNEFCIKCGYDKFTPMSKTEAILLSIHPSDRDYLDKIAILKLER
jgi:RNA polymerase subunit RPABC4/transcription elongation factor Spt4